MTDELKPEFKYYPGAYDDGGAFEPSNAHCEVCDRPCGWRYTGNIYSNSCPDTVCARCLSDGSLFDWVGSEFMQLQDVDFSDHVGAESRRDVMLRTPGVASFNPFTWPVVDGEPMAFLGVGDRDAFWAIPQCRDAMQAMWRDVLGEELPGPTPYLLIFKRLTTDRYGCALNLD